MNITLKFPGGDTDTALMNQLLREGFIVNSVKDALIVNLLVPEERSENYLIHRVPVYRIPREANKAIFCIDVEEKGGGEIKTGEATIVCGLSGKKLRPYYVRRSPVSANETHALFSIRASVVTVTAWRPADTVSIDEHRIVRKGICAWIETVNLWQGPCRELPEALGRFEQAVEAAIEKAYHDNCREVHYANF